MDHLQQLTSGLAFVFAASPPPEQVPKGPITPHISSLSLNDVPYNSSPGFTLGAADSSSAPRSSGRIPGGTGRAPGGSHRRASPTSQGHFGSRSPLTASLQPVVFGGLTSPARPPFQRADPSPPAACATSASHSGATTAATAASAAAPSDHAMPADTKTLAEVLTADDEPYDILYGTLAGDGGDALADLIGLLLLPDDVEEEACNGAVSGQDGGGSSGAGAGVGSRDGCAVDGFFEGAAASELLCLRSAAAAEAAEASGGSVELQATIGWRAGEVTNVGQAANALRYLSIDPNGRRGDSMQQQQNQKKQAGPDFAAGVSPGAGRGGGGEDVTVQNEPLDLHSLAAALDRVDADMGSWREDDPASLLAALALADRFEDSQEEGKGEEGEGEDKGTGDQAMSGQVDGIVEGIEDEDGGRGVLPGAVAAAAERTDTGRLGTSARRPRLAARRTGGAQGEPMAAMGATAVERAPEAATAASSGGAAGGPHWRVLMSAPSPHNPEGLATLLVAGRLVAPTTAVPAPLLAAATAAASATVPLPPRPFRPHHPPPASSSQPTPGAAGQHLPPEGPEPPSRPQGSQGGEPPASGQLQLHQAPQQQQQQPSQPGQEEQMGQAGPGEGVGALFAVGREVQVPAVTVVRCADEAGAAAALALAGRRVYCPPLVPGGPASWRPLTVVLQGGPGFAGPLPRQPSGQQETQRHSPRVREAGPSVRRVMLHGLPGHLDGDDLTALFGSGLQLPGHCASPQDRRFLLLCPDAVSFNALLSWNGVRLPDKPLDALGQIVPRVSAWTTLMIEEDDGLLLPSLVADLLAAARGADPTSQHNPTHTPAATAAPAGTVMYPGGPTAPSAVRPVWRPEGRYHPAELDEMDEMLAAETEAAKAAEDAGAGGSAPSGEAAGEVGAAAGGEAAAAAAASPRRLASSDPTAGATPQPPRMATQAQGPPVVAAAVMGTTGGSVTTPPPSAAAMIAAPAVVAPATGGPPHTATATIASGGAHAAPGPAVGRQGGPLAPARSYSADIDIDDAAAAERAESSRGASSSGLAASTRPAPRPRRARGAASSGSSLYSNALAAAAAPSSSSRGGSASSGGGAAPPGPAPAATAAAAAGVQCLCCPPGWPSSAGSGAGAAGGPTSWSGAAAVELLNKLMALGIDPGIAEAAAPSTEDDRAPFSRRSRKRMPVHYGRRPEEEEEVEGEEGKGEGAAGRGTAAEGGT